MNKAKYIKYIHKIINNWGMDDVSTTKAKANAKKAPIDAKTVHLISILMNEGNYTVIDTETPSERRKLDKYTMFLTYGVVIKDKDDKGKDIILANLAHASTNHKNSYNELLTDIHRSSTVYKIMYTDSELILTTNSDTNDQNPQDDILYGIILSKVGKHWSVISDPERIYCNTSYGSKFSYGGVELDSYSRIIIGSQLYWNDASESFRFKPSGILGTINRKHYEHQLPHLFDKAYEDIDLLSFRDFMNRVVFEGLFPIAYDGRESHKTLPKIDVISGTYHRQPKQMSLFAKPAKDNSHQLEVINDNKFIQQIIAYDNPNLEFISPVNAYKKLQWCHANISPEFCRENAEHDFTDEVNEHSIIANSIKQMMKKIADYAADNGRTSITYNIFKVSNRLYVMNPKSLFGNNLINSQSIYFPTILCKEYPKGFQFDIKLNKPLIVFGARRASLYAYSSLTADSDLGDTLDSNATTIRLDNIRIKYRQDKRHSIKIHDIDAGGPDTDTRAKALKTNKAFQQYVVNH